MIKTIRARISRAWAALFAMTVIAMSVFVAPQVADARGGGFSSGGARVSMGYSRSYSTVRVAPRVYVAPRPMVIVRPRPVVIARPVMIYRQPMLLPYVAPQTYVQADGGQVAPVVVESGTSVLLKTLWIVLLIGTVIALCGGCYYGCGYYGNVIVDSFDIFTDAMIIEEIFDGGIATGDIW